MNRRTFIRTAGIASLGIGSAGKAIGKEFLFKTNAAENGLKRLVILHTNDMHSHLDPFSETDPKYAGQGGMARRASLIKQIRAEGHSTLLLDAGDVFQGTPYFNLFKGEPEFKMMSAMGYDVGTLGNHDFDNGIEGLVDMMRYAQFPFVNANYLLSDTQLEGKVKPYTIIQKESLKIGVIGVGVDLQGLVSPSLVGKVRYSNPIPVAQELANRLKFDFGCHYIILLSHLGYSYKGNQVSDLVLAEQTENIDLIVGGHTHTFLEKPTLVKNLKNQAVLVSQAGWAGLLLGRIDVYFSPKGHAKGFESSMNEISKKTIGI